MSDRRFVVDTSVIVSASLFQGSVPRLALDAAFARGSVLFSDATIAELLEVLERDKLDRYSRRELRLSFLANVLRIAEKVDVSVTFRECRDPRDDKFLELAVSGRATHIITGDADLLVLNPFRGVDIVRPADFLSILDDITG